MIGTVVVGAGAGGLGPVVYAARSGLLDAWLEEGLTVIERRAEASSTLSRYALLADSFSGSFLEGLEGPAVHPLLLRVRDSAEGRALLRFADTRPPLTTVGAFLARLEAEIEATVNACRAPGTRFVRGREAAALHLRNDRVDVEVRGEGDHLAARTVILALGGAALASGDPHASEEVLTEEGVASVVRGLAGAARAEVVIVGGSHSAFSVAWILAERAPAGLFAEGAIALVTRRPPAIFYRSAADASADGYQDFTVQDVCPRTLRVHQLGGLRGDGRELWRRITRRPGASFEARVRLLDEVRDAAEVRARLARATIVVPATGYAPRRLPTFVDGDEIAFRTEHASGSSVDERCRVLTAAGVPLPRVFSLGMASGFVPSGSMGGEPSFRGHTNGVWLYQHHLGQRVYEGVQAVLAGSGW